MALKQTFGFIGAGRMATALAGGMAQAGLVRGRQLLGTDVVPAAANSFAKVTGGRVVKNPAALLRQSDVVVLAVKPHQVIELLGELAEAATAKHLFISIAAGVTLEQLETVLGGKARVIRVMPNTPALVGEGACGFALGQAATAGDSEMVKQLLSSVGIAYEVKENLIDAVTGLSGSGPAYGYTVIDALSDGGVAVGLPRDIATRLAAQTMLGAAKMVLETGKHPGELKDMVCSPGGTTIEGVHELEEGGVRNAMINAVRASAERATELGQD